MYSDMIKSVSLVSLIGLVSVRWFFRRRRVLKLRTAVALEAGNITRNLNKRSTAFNKFRTSCDCPVNSANVSETTAVVCPCPSSSKLFSGIFLMNKNAQHSYKFFNDFPLWYNSKNRPWALKIWLGTLWSITVPTVGDRRLHNSTNANA